MWMWMRIVVVVGLVACDGGATKPDCAGAADGLVRSIALKTDGAAAKTALATRCRDDAWTAAAASCIRDAKSREAEVDCRFKHLTGAQAEKLGEAIGSLGGGATEALAAMQTFKDKMCACKNADCAKDVSDEMTTWSQEMSKQMPNPPKLSEQEIKLATEIGTAMGECMQRAMMPSDDPLGAIIDIESLAPPRGDAAGGTYVRISGNSFLDSAVGNPKVFFGAREGKVVRIASDKELIVEAPAGTAGETVDVRIAFERGGERTLRNSFEYVAKH